MSKKLTISNKQMNRTSAFTIVELLIVIVIIGILAAITIVSYTGITKKANEATIQAELTNASKKLDIYYTQYGYYPSAIGNDGCPTLPTPDTSTCIKFGTNTNYTYTPIGTTNYNLTANDKNNPTIAYRTRPSSSPSLATSSTSSSTCPTGYITVPGSVTYGTNDFCVMKYEAKNDGSGNAVSTATGTPWVSITQTDSITKASAACTGCHLITEAEWMTLAQNVLSVKDNWSGGAVGSGYIYSGHNDNAPASALAADASDANGYAGETNTGGNQKRTLKLTNNEVIWDMAGNVWEWTSGQTANGTASQIGISGNVYASWIEYPTINVAGSLAVNVTPGGTGLTSASSWTSMNGIGKLISNPADTVLHGFFRGGTWYDGSGAGVLALLLSHDPGITGVDIGFRVAR